MHLMAVQMFMMNRLRHPTSWDSLHSSARGMGLCLQNLHCRARPNRSPSFFIQHWNCSGFRVPPVQALYNTRRTFGSIQHHASPKPCG